MEIRGIQDNYNLPISIPYSMTHLIMNFSSNTSRTKASRCPNFIIKCLSLNEQVIDNIVTLSCKLSFPKIKEQEIKNKANKNLTIKRKFTQNEISFF